MRGYAHVIVIGRAGATTSSGFIINAMLPHGDRFKRFPFSVTGHSDTRVEDGDWVLVSGQLSNDQRIVAREVLLLSGNPATVPVPLQGSDRPSGEFERKEIALDGYWQARRGMPVWVRRHQKMIRKKVT